MLDSGHVLDAGLTVSADELGVHVRKIGIKAIQRCVAGRMVLPFATLGKIAE